MNIFRGAGARLEAADPKTFSGVAHIQRLASSEAGVPIVVYRVAFEIGGRTHWHTHSGAQWLFVVEGRVRVQKWGEPAHEVEAGDAVVIAPGEKHWHGAASASRGVHIAVNVNAVTSWLEAVGDGQAAGRE